MPLLVVPPFPFLHCSPCPSASSNPQTKYLSSTKWEKGGRTNTTNFLYYRLPCQHYLLCRGHTLTAVFILVESMTSIWIRDQEDPRVWISFGRRERLYGQGSGSQDIFHSQFRSCRILSQERCWRLAHMLSGQWCVKSIRRF